MKIIQGIFYMHLPDDFEGSIRDAINLTLDNIETSPVINKGVLPETTERVKAATEALWAEFDKATRKGGKYNGTISLQTLNDGKWHMDEEL